MKKPTRLFILFICIATLFMLSACSGAPKHQTDGEFVISADKFETVLEDFVSSNTDRTSGEEGESDAADYLCAKLESYGYAANSVGFSYRTNDDKSKQSQNVVAVYPAANDSAKNVVIGAYYDNSYGEKQADGSIVGTHGALSNGTGVATSLCIAEYLVQNKVKLPFNITFAFFGASSITTSGASQFLIGKNGLTAQERANTVLMIELQRLGVDYVYAFSDARSTRREGFFDGIAKENKLAIYKPSQKTPVMSTAYSINGVPYFQWAQNGVFPVFLNEGIPTLGLMGANWETLDITDAESSEHESITLTRKDNLNTLKSYYPDYASKLATAASLVIKSLTDAEFLSVMQYDRDNFPDTAILTKGWVWSLIALAIILIVVIVQMFIVRRLAKKYPQQPPQPPKQVKMAVFGMDYEDKNSDSVYIDIKKATGDSIFPGIENNDAPSKPPIDPFGIFVGHTERDREPVEIISPQEAAESQNAEAQSIESQNAEDQSASAGIESEKENPVPPVEENSSNTADEAETSALPEEPSKPTAIEKKPLAKKPVRSSSETAVKNSARKTVSAGKSTHAGRSTEKSDDATDENK